MAGRKRARALIVGEAEGAAVARTLGRVVRSARKRRGLTQARLGQLIGLSQSQVSAVERGLAAHLPLRSWFALGLALGEPFAASFSRPRDEPADTGHLELQEMVLRQGERLGWPGGFEVPTRPSDPAYSVDVLVRDDRTRRLLILECWNRFGDIGAAARSSARKIAEAGRLAAALGGDGGPYAVHACWLIRPTAANRELVRRYPHVFRAQCPASSSGWADALTSGGSPPSLMGLIWADPSTGRFVPARLGRTVRSAGRC